MPIPVSPSVRLILKIQNKSGRIVQLVTFVSSDRVAQIFSLIIDKYLTNLWQRKPSDVLEPSV